MNRRMFLQLASPAAIVGLVLLAVSLGSIWAIQRLQENVSNILADNVRSAHAGQQLEINLRQLRWHTLINLMSPSPRWLELIEKDRESLEKALAVAKAGISTPRERELVDEIERRYRLFSAEMAKSQMPVTANPPTGADYLRWAEEHPLREIANLCHELVEINTQIMEQTAADTEQVGRRARIALLALGLLGPVGGLIIGYAASRAWSRSIAQFSIRLQDVHAHLDENVGEFKLDLSQDWDAVNRQLDGVTARVKEAAEQIQRQQAEILRAEQLAAVGQLAAGVAHEIRNPLTAIKMLIGAALRSRSPQNLTEADLHVIYDEIFKLEQTVQFLLDYAKPRPMQRQDADFRQALLQAVNLVRSQAQLKKIEIAVDAPAEPVVGRFDPGQLNDVFVNLLINAVDALPAGGRIDVGLEPQTDGATRVSVCDNGPGVAAEIAPRLFEPFTSAKATGTGLGLNVCQRIVRNHGGDITYEPRAGGGAKFVVTLPRPSETEVPENKDVAGALAATSCGTVS